MKKDIKIYISKCESCQKNKYSHATKMPLEVTSTASKPFEKCFLDIVGPLVLTENGNKYMLTFQDDLTKFSEAIAIPNQEAITVAKAFVTNIICKHGIPETLLTDQGTNFLSNIFKNVCKLLKIKKIQTTAYHPQSNGALERSHRTLSEYLRHFINSQQVDWDEWLPFAIFTYNTTPHTSTNFTPFELLYGEEATLPTSITTKPKICYNYDDYVQNIKAKMQTTRNIARDEILKHKNLSKLYYDKKGNIKHFKVGDKVLLHNDSGTLGTNKKFNSKWLGPYEIVSIDSDVNCTILIKKKRMKVHFNRLKYYNT